MSMKLPADFDRTAGPASGVRIDSPSGYILTARKTDGGETAMTLTLNGGLSVDFGLTAEEAARLLPVLLPETPAQLSAAAAVS